MEGRGVTNFEADKPSYSFSAATTEFDDALIQRGIITQEQAIFRKGASSEEAARLANIQNEETAVAEKERRTNASDNDDDDDDDYLLDEEDDDFMNRYRQQRLQEMQQESVTKPQEFGEPVLIARDEWSRHVNEDSKKVWVVVCLTSSDAERTGNVEAAVCQLAALQRQTKFVLIPSKMAIPNWPDENLPSLFLYRHGKMQREIVRMDPETNVDDLEVILEGANVL